MWKSLSETSAIRYYWELKNKPGFYWNGRKKKAVTDPKRRSEYRSLESAMKYHPKNAGSADRWKLGHYTVWTEITEYSSCKSVVVK